jgi:uncharacterized protein YqgC (DUF456 family)
MLPQELDALGKSRNAMPWDAITRIALIVLLDIVLLAGLIAIPLGLSGNFIILGAALVVAIITHFTAVPIWALIVMAALVATGEIVESLLGSVMARRYGASKWGMLGAFVGGIAGAILGTPIAPIIGTIIGSFIGAALGAILVEWIRLQKLRSSMPAGWGAILGKALSSIFKIGIGVAMVVYIIARTH